MKPTPPSLSLSAFSFPKKKVVAGACLILLIQVSLTLTSVDEWGGGTKTRMIELEQVRASLLVLLFVSPSLLCPVLCTSIMLLALKKQIEVASLSGP